MATEQEYGPHLEAADQAGDHRRRAGRGGGRDVDRAGRARPRRHVFPTSSSRSAPPARRAWTMPAFTRCRASPTATWTHRSLGFEKGVTPFSDEPAVIPIPHRIAGQMCRPRRSRAAAAVISGKGYDAIAADMVDMETYAVFRAAERLGVPVIGLRGISDGRSDLTGLHDWLEFLHILDEKLAPSSSMPRATMSGRGASAQVHESSERSWPFRAPRRPSAVSRIAELGADCLTGGAHRAGAYDDRHHPHPRFRQPGHPAHRPAGARGRRLFRDRAVQPGRGGDGAVEAEGADPVGRARVGARQGFAAAADGGLRGRPADPRHLLRRAGDRAPARRQGRGRAQPRIRPRLRRGDEAGGALRRHLERRRAPPGVDEPWRPGRRRCRLASRWSAAPRTRPSP